MTQAPRRSLGPSRSVCTIFSRFHSRVPSALLQCLLSKSPLARVPDIERERWRRGAHATHSHAHIPVPPASQHPGHCHTLTPHAHAHTLLHCVVAGEGAHTGRAHTHKAQTHTHKGGASRQAGWLPAPTSHCCTHALHTQQHVEHAHTRTSTGEMNRGPQGAAGGRGRQPSPPQREKRERGHVRDMCTQLCTHE